MLATLEEHPDARVGALLAILTGPGDLGAKLDACADAWSARLREGGFARLVVEYRLQNHGQGLFARRYLETVVEDYAALATALDTAAHDSGISLGLPAPDLISLASALFDGAALREVAMPGQVTPELLQRGLRRLCGLPDAAQAIAARKRARFGSPGLVGRCRSRAADGHAARTPAPGAP
jgi:hypothetical protein